MGTQTKTNNNKKMINPQELVNHFHQLNYNFNLLALSSYAMQEILLEKGIFTKEELDKKISEVYKTTSKPVQENPEVKEPEIVTE